MPKRYLLLCFCMIASALALAACGGSESDEDKVVDVIESSATSTDPADCEALNTIAFLEQVEKESGQDAVKSCEEDAADEEKPDEVNVTEVEVDGTNATANAAFVGGSLDGQTLTIALVEEDGDWKLDQLTGFAEFDKAAFVDAFTQGFEESGELEDAQVSCIAEEFEAASDAELEDLFINGTIEQLGKLIQACE